MKNIKHHRAIAGWIMLSNKYRSQTKYMICTEKENKQTTNFESKCVYFWASGIEWLFRFVHGRQIKKKNGNHSNFVFIYYSDEASQRFFFFFFTSLSSQLINLIVTEKKKIVFYVTYRFCFFRNQSVQIKIKHHKHNTC